MAFDPAYIYADVCKSVQFIHFSGVLHKAISADLERYLPGRRPKIAQFLGTLKAHDRKVSIEETEERE
jgi:hypothetical protein